MIHLVLLNLVDIFDHKGQCLTNVTTCENGSVTQWEPFLDMPKVAEVLLKDVTALSEAARI